MKRILAFLLIITLSNLMIAQTTAIPDSNFEQALIDLGFDTGSPDGTIPTANIDTLTSLGIHGENISDLTGIEDFITLTELICGNNQLTSLDVSQNTDLARLFCHSNQLTNLVVTQNTALIYLSCSNNQLNSLDVSQHPSLTYLYCRNNQLTSLNIAQSNALVQLNCEANQLTSLDVTQNTALTELHCSSNQITNLNITQNTALTQLACGDNQLTNLDVTQHSALTRLYCYENQINNLDVSQNTSLINLYCGNNLLTNLDVTQNTVLTQLYCDINQLTNLNVAQNTSLTQLRCNNNQLINLDVTQHTALTQLYCWSNQLISLNVTYNTALTELKCEDNQLSSLNISQHPALTQLYCNNNQLTSLDLTQNTSLTKLHCQDNQLTCLNVKNGNNYSIGSYFNTLNNPNLTCIAVDDPSWSLTNWNNIDPTTTFSVSCINNCTPSPCNVSANFTTYSDSLGVNIFYNQSLGSTNNVHWAFGDGTTSTSTSQFINHTFSTNGTYVIVLTVNDSTIGSSCFDYFLDTVTVTYIPNPLQCNAGFVMYPDTTTGDVTVVNSATGTNLTYLWDFGDGNTSTQQNPNYTYSTAGPFYLCLTVDDGAGCVDMYCDSIGENGVVFNKSGGFTINVISSTPITTSLNNYLELNSEVIIYPNPTSHQLSIETELDLREITIIDITGKIVMSTKKNTNIINVTNLSDGIYFIKLVVEERTITKKFVKQ
jgi:Leucine-rich repeat (LRR) protein